MIQTFFALLPFALAAAVSPMMLTEQTLLLTGANGRIAGRHYAIAAALVLLLFVGLLVFFGQAISLPQEPSLNSNLDIIIGILLVSASLLIRRRRKHGTDQKKEKKTSQRFGPSIAYAFGAFSMATNFTTLALVVPAAKEIAVSGSPFPERELLVLLLVLIASTPAWLPLALATIAPGRAERVLLGIGQFIETNGRRLTVILLLVIGLFLVGRGVIGLIG
jgi:threonine/homoserine/homoserine lactone efflux protein